MAGPILPTKIVSARNRARSAGLPLAALGEFVLADGEEAVFGADGGEFGEVALDLLPDAAERNPEDALAALEQVDHFVGRRALVDADAVAHQGDLGQVAGAAVAQVVHCGADLLQRDAGVEQALDHLQDQDVAEAVEALGAGAMGSADAGLDQAGPGPVVELAVGDAGRVAGRGPAVANLGTVVVDAQRRGDLAGLCTGVKQCALLLSVWDYRPVPTGRSVIAPGSGHGHLHRERPPWVLVSNRKPGLLMASTIPHGASRHSV